MIVRKTSIFPASRQQVFQKLQHPETLQYIARPYASFEPVSGKEAVRTPGSTSAYRMKLCGIFPFAVHTIHILRFDPDVIQSQEGNRHVPVWNHSIFLKRIDEDHTEYTDRLEISAGWKTVFIWIWANAFYRHRQKKWIHLLKEKDLA